MTSRTGPSPLLFAFRELVPLATLALCLAPTTLPAQQAPEVGYIFPPAVVAGTTTEIQIGGFDFTPDMQFFVHDDGIQIELLDEAGEALVPPPPYWFGPRAATPARPIAREIPARLTVAADTPEGWVSWQVANANGASSTGTFYVSRATEVLESRWRDDPQPLDSIPVSISGRLGRLTEVDKYQWTADRDELISVDLMARRLGSDFLGVLQVHDAEGELVADVADTAGQDRAAVTFAGQAGRTYTISLHDVDYRGDPSYVYRLEIRPGPRIVGIRPAAVRQGEKQQVEFVGWGVRTGSPRLETLRQSITIPTELPRSNFLEFLETPSGSVEVTISVGDLRELVLDDARQHEPERLEAPVAVNRRLPPDVDEHRYEWWVEEDESWRLSLQSQAVGGSLDVELVLLDPDGKIIAEQDDLPGTTDAGLEFRAPRSGQYTCVIRDLTSRSGSLDEYYRLALERPEPDFALSVPQRLAIPLGGTTQLAVQVERMGGFEGEILLAAEGLPGGVRPEGEWRIPADQAEVKVTLRADDDADVVASPIWLTGRAVIQGEEQARQATANTSGNLTQRSFQKRRHEPLLLTVTMTPPFDLLLVDRERQREVHRGTTYRAEFEIVRHEGFEGEIELRMAAQQARYRQGIRGGAVLVSPDADRAIYPSFMPEWLGTDLTRRMLVHGVARVADPRGRPRYLVKAADSRITMIMEGALLKVRTPPGTQVLRMGSRTEIPFQLTRSAKLPVGATVHLEIPECLEGLCEGESVYLAVGDESGTVRIHLGDDPRLVGSWTFKIVATALEDDQWPVVSEAELPVWIEAE